MSDLVIRDGKVLTPDGWRREDLAIVDGSIAATAPPGAAVFDASGLLVAPGLIDLQVNGGWGLDITSDGPSMWSLGDRLAEHGVTAYLPTVVTSPPSSVVASLDALHRRPTEHRGAEPLGLHLEGPMIAVEKRGAHRSEHIRPPSLDLIDGWSRAGGVTMVTLAPELDGARVVIGELVSRGIVVAAGHTQADAEQAAVGFDTGVTHVTHLFNAMPSFGHRAPGLGGAALARQHVTAGLIVDGHHVHPDAVATAWHAKGPGGIVLVSDSVAALGLDHGEERLGDRPVVVREGAVRTPDGTLAGSAITLIEGVRNLIRLTGCRVEDALRAASSTPAGVIGATDRGRLSPGTRGDVVVLTEALDVVATVVGGRLLRP
ncbi:MAG: N-acetylglucosamine-6-phosphate deacetylase [Actinomycetota bacterium]